MCVFSRCLNQLQCRPVRRGRGWSRNHQRSWTPNLCSAGRFLWSLSWPCCTRYERHSICTLTLLLLYHHVWRELNAVQTARRLKSSWDKSSMNVTDTNMTLRVSVVTFTCEILSVWRPGAVEREALPLKIRSLSLRRQQWAQCSWTKLKNKMKCEKSTDPVRTSAINMQGNARIPNGRFWQHFCRRPEHRLDAN